eukprot:1405209-Amphidinium_carterae.1
MTWLKPSQARVLFVPANMSSWLLARPIYDQAISLEACAVVLLMGWAGSTTYSVPTHSASTNRPCCPL